MPSLVKLYAEIRELLIKTRDALGLSGREMAKLLDVSHTTYARWESTDRQPTLFDLHEIAAHLGKSVSVTFEDPASADQPSTEATRAFAKLDSPLMDGLVQLGRLATNDPHMRAAIFELGQTGPGQRARRRRTSSPDEA